MIDCSRKYPPTSLSPAHIWVLLWFNKTLATLWDWRIIKAYEMVPALCDDMANNRKYVWASVISTSGLFFCWMSLLLSYGQSWWHQCFLACSYKFAARMQVEFVFDVSVCLLHVHVEEQQCWFMYFANDSTSLACAVCVTWRLMNIYECWVMACMQTSKLFSRDVRIFFPLEHLCAQTKGVCYSEHFANVWTSVCSIH